MKMKVTEGEASFIEKIRRTKESTMLEFTYEEKLIYLKYRVKEITRDVIREILRKEIK